MTNAPPQHLSSLVTSELAGLADATDGNNCGALEVVRRFLDLPQVDRLVSHEEIQELEQVEDKIYRNEVFYEDKISFLSEKKFLSFCFVLLSGIHIFSVCYITELKVFPFLIRLLLSGGPAYTFYVLVYLYISYCNSKNSQPRKIPRSSETENDDDWQETMTITEFTSRQKDLVETLIYDLEPVKKRLRTDQKEWNENRIYQFLIPIIYSAVHLLFSIILFLKFSGAFHLIDSIFFGSLLVLLIFLMCSKKEGSIIE